MFAVCIASFPSFPVNVIRQSKKFSSRSKKNNDERNAENDNKTGAKTMQSGPRIDLSPATAIMTQRDRRRWWGCGNDSRHINHKQQLFNYFQWALNKYFNLCNREKLRFLPMHRSCDSFPSPLQHSESKLDVYRAGKEKTSKTEK